MNGTTVKHSFFVMFVFVIAGLLGNYFKYPIFLNVDFLFGSIFAMLALQFLGFSRGVVVAALIAGYTWVLWNHPYAIIIMTAEVAVVAWLMSRHRIGMVLADTFYWLIFGIPLIYLFYHLIMGAPFSSVTIVMTKQALNGIANTLVARILFSIHLKRSQAGHIFLVEAISNAFAFFVLLPVLIILAVSSRSDFAETDANIRSDLLTTSRFIAHNLENWLKAEKLDPSQIQHSLNVGLNVDNLTYTLLDSNGNIMATNRKEQKILTPFNRGNGSFVTLKDDLLQWFPLLPKNVSIMERWQKSSYIAEVTTGKPANFKLIIEQPVAPFQKILYDRYSKRFVLLFVLLLLALVIAEILGRRMALTTQKLAKITKDMPTRITNNETVQWPSSAVYETSQLISNFNEMSRALTCSFAQNRNANKILEQQVADRTMELLKAKEEAEAANISKSRFLSVVAHEFHTPLGLLTVSTDILDRYWNRLDNNERMAQHEQIRTASKQMSNLVNSVIAHSRQEKTASGLNLEMTDIEKLCKKIAEEVKTVWCDGHDFKVIISKDCDELPIDATLFRRVLENLLTNAFRFTPPEGTVRLTVKRTQKHLQLEIIDNGIGIPEKDQQKIFEAFYRSSNVEARSGLGLGLSIVYEALQTMKGSITMTSKVGFGTTFRVELPWLQK